MSRLVGVLSGAARLNGRLAGEGGCLHNAHVLMLPFVCREAVLSFKIEGTQATLGELLFLIKRKILSTLLLNLSAFFEASRRDY